MPTQEERFETLCKERFAGAPIEKLIPLAMGTTVDQKPISPSWQADITKKIARAILLQHEHLERLLPKLLSISTRKSRLLALELMQASMIERRERQETDVLDSWLTALFQVLSTTRDRRIEKMVLATLEYFPEDAVRVELAKQLS